jgi:hypothetical protein
MRQITSAIQNSGYGNCILSQRKKMQGENGKPVHGYVIYQRLGENTGKYPFVEAERQIHEQVRVIMATYISRFTSYALRFRVINILYLREGLRHAAALISDRAIKWVAAGGYGAKTGRSLIRHKIEQNRGRAIPIYVRGVLSGRFYKGFRSSWSLRPSMGQSRRR